MRLLIAEDDPPAARRAVADFEALGHEVTLAEDGRTALSIATEGFDAVLLDVMLPYVDGVQITRTLREHGLEVPIVIITALADLERKLAGLEAGADDYLVKPVTAEEIIARLRAILRRSTRAGNSGVMRAGDITVHEGKHRALRAGRPLSLPKAEFQMLCALVRHKNDVVTRAMFYRDVLGHVGEPATNIVESYIRRLRAQLNAPGEIDPIETIRSVGYMLVARD